MPGSLPNGTAASKLHFDDIPSCVADFAAGKFLIVLDDATRENEGDLIIAARHLTPSKAAFMIRYTSGYLCAPLSMARAKELNLAPMVPPQANEDPKGTAYTITVDADGDTYGITTGISARDRSMTCNVLADPTTAQHNLRRPGHVVPLLVREGGVRRRRGHTEAGWELGRLAGISPSVAVIGEMVVDGEAEPAPDGQDCELVPELKESGMMRAEACLAFGKQWGIRCCTIEDLVQYVESNEGPLQP